MLAILALWTISAAASVPPVVAAEWLQSHLTDPNVCVIDVSDREQYARAHIPGARSLDHMATVGDNHRLLPPETLARAWAKAGARDAAHIVIYGDSPMATGWMYMSLAAIGHGDHVSMLDGGIRVWQAEQRPTSTASPPAASGSLTVRQAPDVIVDAAWVRGQLESPRVRLLDVRTTQEWNSGHLPGATLILWQDLFADLRMLKLKTPEEMRGVLERAGVAAGQEVVTYCAVGMRASLMYWAARTVGLPARVYVGSWQDWQRDAKNPVAR